MHRAEAALAHAWLADPVAIDADEVQILSVEALLPYEHVHRAAVAAFHDDGHPTKLAHFGLVEVDGEIAEAMAVECELFGVLGRACEHGRHLAIVARRAIADDNVDRALL